MRWMPNSFQAEARRAGRSVHPDAMDFCISKASLTYTRE